MADFGEAKALIKALVRIAHGGRIHIQELEKAYRQQNGENIRFNKFGFETLRDMLASFEEFTLEGYGLATIVKTSEADHIQQMNSNSKNRNRLIGFAKAPTSAIQSSFNSGNPYVSSQYGLSREPGESLDHFVAPKPVFAPARNDLNFDNSTVVITVLELVNPHRFWFTDYDTFKQLNFLMTEMSRFYGTGQNAQRVAVSDLVKDSCVAALYSGLWHRAKVLKVLSEEFVRVFYVDFGTVEEVSVKTNVRRLQESFAILPAVAQRGVLSHIQPITRHWSAESIKFFHKAVMQKKLNAKILKKNIKDSSYYLSIKTRIDLSDVTQHLVSAMMIEKELGIFDKEFFDKPMFNLLELEFDYYETGMSIDAKTNALARLNGWVPNDKTTKVIAPHETSSVVGKTSLVKVPLSEQVHVNMQNDNSRRTEQKSTLPRRLQSSQLLGEMKKSHSCLTRCTKSFKQNIGIPEDVPRQIAAQNIENKFQVGNIIVIYVHVVYHLERFYFYLKDEFEEIRDYLGAFNDDCKIKQVPLTDILIGNDVMVFADNNFCRGRVLDGDGRNFKILLSDFAIVVERHSDEIYYLDSKWLVRSAAIYRGKLASIPYYINPKSVAHRNQMAMAVNFRFLEAKITQIEKKLVKLILTDNTINDELFK